MNSIDKALKEKKIGLYYGTRVILPFVADILKAVIDDEIITDFSPVSDGAYYEKFDDFTEIYFFDHEDILKDVSKYETIKLIVVDEEDDMFDFENHRRISLNPIEKHTLEISELNDDVIFIE
ncbi:MAG: hypothetical protein KDC88_11460 [Ignavibacteriae bacterium]|nr:hypothetical protein [Ignavibacteriota bacterium]MCB9207314.1 hypothetical protein [Ignavibacteriales bacterium]MCB9209009.1 hypothetical protein [Ignavibacteriales bacterium]MCB9218069.1 hypothetical protein [Ignavibacteriales bacterium]MCB9260458.1 hypothetical protein [Ignavibacteriales bacterium]